MSKSNIEIIIIDDNLESDAPLIIELNDLYSTVKLYYKSSEALNYIDKNLDIQRIIVLDIKLPAKEPDGHEVLKIIREKSQLIPVIIWSALIETEEPFSDFINNHAFAFIPQNSPYKQLIKKIKEAEDALKQQVSSILEEWITIHSDDKREKPYMISKNGKQYTLNQVLSEIRKRTKLGIFFEKGITKLSIELLARNIENLKDNK